MPAHRGASPNPAKVACPVAAGTLRKAILVRVRRVRDADQCAGRRARAIREASLRSEHSNIMKRDTSGTWALVINGTRCRVLRGVSANGEDSLSELVLRSEARNLRDIMSDKPGRSFASTGGGRRSALEYASDPIAEDQREFIRQVIAILDSHRRAGDFDKLAVFAEHDMLGHLRRMMPRTLAGLVIREVPKNLLHLLTHELAEAVARELKDGTGFS